MNTLIAISGLGVFCLIAEIFNLRKLIVPVAILGLLAILGLTVSEFDHPSSHYNSMIIVNNFSVAFSSLFIILTIFIVALSGDFYKDHPTKISDYGLRPDHRPGSGRLRQQPKQCPDWHRRGCRGRWRGR